MFSYFHVHLVFVTKCRREVFTKQILKELKEIFSSVCTDLEASLTEFEGEGDHVHLLIEYPPKVSVSKLVNSLNGVSSRLIHKSLSNHRQALWGGSPDLPVLMGRCIFRTGNDRSAWLIGTYRALPRNLYNSQSFTKTIAITKIKNTPERTISIMLILHLQLPLIVIHFKNSTQHKFELTEKPLLGIIFT